MFILAVLTSFWNLTEERKKEEHLAPLDLSASSQVKRNELQLLTRNELGAWAFLKVQTVLLDLILKGGIQLQVERAIHYTSKLHLICHHCFQYLSGVKSYQIKTIISFIIITMSQIIGKIQHYIQKGIRIFFNVVQKFLMRTFGEV